MRTVPPAHRAETWYGPISVCSFASWQVILYVARRYHSCFFLGDHLPFSYPNSTGVCNETNQHKGQKKTNLKDTKYNSFYKLKWVE